MPKIFNWAKKIYADKFKRYLIAILLIIGLIFVINGSEPVTQTTNGLELHFFYHPQCSHCNAMKPFIEQFTEKYPEVKFIYHDVTKPEVSADIVKYANKVNAPVANLGVPFIVFDETYFIGFSQTIVQEIDAALEAYAAGEPPAEKIEEAEPEKTITLPILGQINVLDYSLPALAVTLGLIDGFNPCAMWVLVYLISLVITIGDRRKIWIIVGSFVLASGILYFLFMTAWLNAFLVIGFFRPLTIIIGIGALYFGITSIRDYFKKGEICKVGDIESKQKTMSRMQKIVHSPITIAAILGIIGLAFVVNSIEFVCSSAIPAIFTYVLSISDLPALGYYGYILLYDLFFMLDDLIIFSLAAFTVTSTSIGTKYAKYCKLIGGIIMLVLGMILAFAPQLLA